MFLDRPCWKIQELIQQRCNVTGKMRWCCGFTTNHSRKRTVFRMQNLQHKQENSLKRTSNHAKNIVKHMIAKIPMMKKNVFYTHGKQPGGQFMIDGQYIGFIFLNNFFCLINIKYIQFFRPSEEPKPNQRFLMAIPHQGEGITSLLESSMVGIQITLVNIGS